MTDQPDCPYCAPDVLTVERHDEPYTEIRMGEGGEIARLLTFHHEAAGWVDAAVRMGAPSVVVLRPRDYDGCPCNRCAQGWTQAQADERDRELPGDREIH